MAIEIERKFLVAGQTWRSLGVGVAYRQGYIFAGRVEDGRTVRVRVAGEQGYLTLKGASQGWGRLEFEYEIPYSEAVELLDQLCDRPQIEKVRYKIPWAGLIWEVDEFGGDNTGLILAEVELADPQQAITLPDWIGLEVTGDRRYDNSYLSRHPYRSWGTA